jgi:hypothetical protein
MGAIYHRCAPALRLNTVKRGDSPRWERLLIYLVAMLAVENAARLAAVDRVIQSSVFRQSETLRRLLRYLADKAFEGTGDHLKEYTIGIDGLGKPSSYDPRQDSVVRIHVGRLRQKLSEYYLTEGKDEPVIIDLPKGHFKLQFEIREAIPAANIDHVTPVEEGAGVDIRRRFFPFLVAALVLTTGWAIWATSRWVGVQRASAAAGDYWNPEMRELWKPFLTPGRPVIVSAAYPLFIGLQGAGFYRDASIESLDQVPGSPRLAAIRKALGDPAIFARHNYTTTGDANALFSLGRIFAGRTSNVSIIKSAELTWQQLAGNNLVMIGGPRFFAPLLKELQTDLSYSVEQDGIRVLHPKAGKPEQMRDHYPAIGASDTKAPRDSGEVYALITHVPGPQGRSDILSFSSNHNPGTLAAVDWFTNPDLVRLLASKIRNPNGQLPRFYQLVLKVRYQEAVPTDVSLVAHVDVESSPAR